MEVHFTTDQQSFVRQAIESGRYRGEEDAVVDALALWEERERRRAETLFAVDLAEASYARGEGYVVANDEDAVRLFDQIEADARQRLSAKKTLR